MDPDESAREVPPTDWVTAAMAGRGGDGPPPPTTSGREVAREIAWFIVGIVTAIVMSAAADAAFWPLTR